ncbi:MAG: hypothetical protein WDZ76_14690 [Pseudohongiellaceae bacterium]
MTTTFRLACALTAFFAGFSSAQDISWPDPFNDPMPLFDEAMGNFHYPISTDNEIAQAYFDQGFQLMYSFAKIDSARSFREAQLADPDCAICYWGEAWSWGSYLNGAMTAADAPRAYYALQQALARIDRASPREADMIRALSVRYIQNFEPAERRVQDQAYADAMADLAEKYPENLDIVTLYGDALFLLEERRGYRDLNDPNVIRLHGVLSSVLERDITHPGACHLYVHATESTPTPELAAPCAVYLGDSIPGASHINHMPSHTWNEMGLWNEAVRANLKASHSDQKAAFGKGFAIYPTHNLGMLLYAANMDGQGAVAIQAAKDLAKLNNDNSMHVLSLIRFGRFDEVPALTERPAADVGGGLWDFAQGYAALKLGDIDQAMERSDALRELSTTTTSRYRFHDGKDILGTVSQILAGEILWIEGNLEAATAAFREAVAAYDNLNYDEPEPLPFSPRHWLGAAYLEMGAYDNAIEVYQQDLEAHPHNGWSLVGIQQGLAGKGVDDPVINSRLNEAWKRSDTWLRASKF